jgi:hypothetical protein
LADSSSKKLVSDTLNSMKENLNPQGHATP